jgi:uncharacterized membrane protein
MMSLFVEERDIPSTENLLWALITAVENLPRWVPNVQTAKLLGQQQTGIGRRQQLITRGQLGEWAQEQVIIAWEPGRRIGWRALTNQIDARELEQIEDLQTIITLTKRQGHTNVTIETSWVPLGLKGQLFSFFTLKPAIRKQTKGMLQALEIQIQKKGDS